MTWTDKDFLEEGELESYEMKKGPISSEHSVKLQKVV